MSNRWAGFVAVACFAALLAVYLTTMPPSLTWAHHGADGGDLATAVVRGSIPHPPGFPTYLVLGEAFDRLPWRDPAWRLSLMSAVLAAGAGGLSALAVWGLVQRSFAESRRSAFACVTLVSGLVLGLSPLFWSQALIVEVYAPAAFFAALVMALALWRAPAWGIGLAWGLGMGVHLTLLFLAPLVAWAVWRDAERRQRRLFQAGASALAAWGVMYGPLLLARGSVPSPWADLSTPAGWWALVSGKLYRGYAFGLPLVDWPRRLLAWAGLLARQFTPVGAVLAGMGLFGLWRKRSPLARALALAFVVCSLYAMGYNTADSLVYLAPALPLATLWLGEGLAQAVGWLNHRVPGTMWVLLLLPLLQIVLFWGQMDLGSDRTATEWVERVLQESPSEAVLLTARDAHTFTLWYAHDVLGYRPDVVIVDRDLWGHEPYSKMMRDALGVLESNLSVEQVAQMAGRRVVYVSDQLAEENP